MFDINFFSLDAANNLRQSLPYIRKYNNALFVIVIDYLTVDSLDLTLAYDINFLCSLNVRVVLLLNIEEDNTDDIPLDKNLFDKQKVKLIKLKNIIQSLFNTRLANSLVENNLELIESNFISAQSLGINKEKDQYRGKVFSINSNSLKEHLSLGRIIILSPHAFSQIGKLYSISLKYLIPELVKSLNIDKLIFMQKGIFSERLLDKLPLQITVYDNFDFILEDSKLLKLINIAKKSFIYNIKRCHIIDSNNINALLLELFTTYGSGLLLSKEKPFFIREANLQDIGGIMSLISPLEESGVLVPRTKQLLENDISLFHVIDWEGYILGCVALYCYIGSGIAEIACLAVHSKHQENSWGKKLLSHCENLAKKQGANKLLALSNQTSVWFIKQGFKVINFTKLPPEKQILYDHHRQSKILIKDL